MTVGVGIVGAGFISDAYLENLTAFPDLRVVGIADLDLDRARAQAARYGIPWAGSVADLLALPDGEIVVNLTVPAVHVEVSLAAVEAGKHVWTEKPIGVDRRTVRKLLDRARDVGVRVAGAPDTLLGAGHQTALRALAGGRIGAPFAALALFQTPGPEGWHPAPEFLFQAGGGPLLDIGPYYLTQLVQVFGAVRKVTGVGGRVRETRVIGAGPRAGTEFPVTVPTTVSALIEFARGGTAQVLLTFDSALRRTGVVEVSGSLGTAVLPDPNGFGGSAVVHSGGEAEELAAVGHSAARGTGVLDLARAVRAGVAERASGEMAYHVLDVMVAVEESMELGVGVEVGSRVEVSELLPVEWDPFVRTL
ncbi:MULTISPECIES: Gfo/Idh/MocA family protein [Amycolatopsis]|uniref:Gfo/Idh/MocA family oxidoreductase n=1 Tax=Amycolatopsis dendrobii TaxID=2760662 RepID=A0A7W3VXV7_9PSEU|nr:MULTISPECIES: Gfo/Idh/MocA family oxidoreductase [Amycolatopsis]MBB1155014.1 Gfo/Idh/MocA family oxidoreductase [Amycolatopsis dendrobii]UKD56178.1 Gfo/Idh/MocA family oxidoreductase [Amycolatopsis sp. FU40]